MMEKPTALLYAPPAADLAAFSRELCSLRWRIIGFPADTARYLWGCGMTVHSPAEFVGRPILVDKAMGLSAELHAALVADDSDEERESLRKICMPSIDLVYVDLRFMEGEEPDFRNEVTRAVILETAISGGGRFVLCSSEQFPQVLKYLHAHAESSFSKEDHEKFVSSLACETLRRVIEYHRISMARHFRLADGRDSRTVLQTILGESRSR